MIYEFTCYPHEVCYRPHETIGHCYQVGDFIENYTDDYSFKDVPFGCGFSKVHHDEFDALCAYDDGAINFAKEELRSILDTYIDSLGFGSYAFILHNKDTFDKGDKIGQLKKPHFHVLFLLPDDKKKYEPCVKEFYDLLGMFSYERSDFTMRKKNYQRFKRLYPESKHSRYLKYFDACRSVRLRYLCHLDNKEKHQYSLTEVIASFDYEHSAEVLCPHALSPRALFLSLRSAYGLDDYAAYFEFLTSGDLTDKQIEQLEKIDSKIDKYYKSIYYRKGRLL